MSILFEGMPGGILGFLIALVPLILLHEIGHFFVAKKVGVWVREFGIGYPPRIMKLFTFKETEYTLNWLPLGGFVRMEGESMYAGPELEDKEAPEKTEAEIAEIAAAKKHSLYAQSPGKRILIYLGGPLMNILTAWLLAIALFITGIPAETVGIQQIAPNSPAETAGLQSGDIILELDDYPIETLEELSTYIQGKLGQPVAVTLQRDGLELVKTLIPRADPPEGEGAMGITIGYQDLKHYSLHEAFIMGTQQTATMIGFTLIMPIYIIRARLPLAVLRPVGVVGISRLAQHSIQESIAVGALYPLLQNIILLSISLGIFNLLPIPALDGGRILFSIIEKIRAKPLTPELEERILMITFAILISMFLFITALDIFVPVEIP
ncbi:MAG: site-2 protease family protein [Anaerolineae bacterium]|nr:site-2 protease family protein [Anaerolineae bacterium]